MKLYEYALRRMLLLTFVLFAVSLIVFYLARGALPPEYSLSPYITPRMTDPQKLGLAQGLGVATSVCTVVSSIYLTRTWLCSPNLVAVCRLVEVGCGRRLGILSTSRAFWDGENLGRLFIPFPIHSTARSYLLDRDVHHSVPYGDHLRHQEQQTSRPCV